MTASAPRLAKRQLVEPDYWTCPHGVRVRPDPALTYGPEVADLCAKADFAPDPQQELGLDLVFAFRPDGSPASFAFCVICARQNLKSGLFLQCVVGWLFVTDVPEIAWSAHELKTSLDAQAELEDILDSDALSKYLMTNANRGVYDQNGKERIELNTGQKVWFQTRTRDGGRGLKKPKVIIDEAFKFKARTAGALLPILLAQHHPQLLYGSSAPPLDEDAKTLRDVIDRGRHHKSPELSYLEWLAQREQCADPDCRHPKDAAARGLDCALDREHLIRQANPTLTTGRITMRTIRNLRQELPPEEYMRECLGWAEESGDAAGPPAINGRQWHRLLREDAPLPARATMVIDVEPDQSAASIGLAGPGPEGKTLLLVHAGPGIDWVAEKAAAVKDNTELLEVALHPSGQAGVLIPELKAKGLDPHPLVYADLAHGCTRFVTGVPLGRFAHVGQDELDGPTVRARTRKVREGTVWDRSDPSNPIGPVVAVSTAAHRWAVKTTKPDTPPPSPRRAGGTTTAVRRGNDIAHVGF